MPKYTPTPEDIYSTTPCPVCGQDVISGETCSDMCQQAWEALKKDYEQDMMEREERLDRLSSIFEKEIRNEFNGRDTSMD